MEIVIDKLSMIPNERVRVTVSKDGYVSGWGYEVDSDFLFVRPAMWIEIG